MRKLLICVKAALLAGCMSAPGEEIGAVRMKTDERGRLSKVYMEKSTGSSAMDRRVILFARTTFSRRVPDPVPNQVYRHTIHGELAKYPTNIRVWKGGNE
jgi:hypothetical protein